MLSSTDAIPPEQLLLGEIWRSCFALWKHLQDSNKLSGLENRCTGNRTWVRIPHSRFERVNG
jgi:hypothetical protein